MKKSIAVILAISLVLLICVAGCGNKETNGEVNVYNWGEYIDESILDIFEKETGIKVNYSTYSSNEILYSNMQTGAANYDVIIPSDYLISRLIDEDMLEKIDYSNIPNYSLIDDAYKNLEYDPTSEYSVPYMTCTVGIIYNTSMIDEEITSWGAMFDERYAGQILMFDNSRDAMCIALKYLGYSVNTTDEKELNEAYELLESQRPLLQGYVMDQIFDKLEGGEAAIGPYYSGDYLAMLENNPDLAFAIPDEGSNYSVDAMCIPKGAENKSNAEAFINFMCRTDICIKNMDYLYYTSANKEAVEKYSEDLDDLAREIMFPPADVMDRCEVYVNLPQETLDLYNTLWIKLKA